MKHCKAIMFVTLTALAAMIPVMLHKAHRG